MILTLHFPKYEEAAPGYILSNYTMRTLKMSTLSLYVRQIKFSGTVIKSSPSFLPSFLPSFFPSFLWRYSPNRAVASSFEVS
jgi:hypothetical protein